MLFILVFCMPLRAAEIADGMLIVDAIEVVRSDGYQVSYSSRLVGNWMRVRGTPTSSNPIEALRGALSSYDLDIVEVSRGSWVIIAAEKQPDDEPPPVSPEPVKEVAEPPALDEITIVASRHAMYSRNAADQFLTAEDIQLMPHVADDAFRAFHRLPGVAASDFQAPFNLRGGAVDEVKLQINGVEIVEPFHMRTLFQPLSIIDPGIIGVAQVLSGGFTAKHGQHMSGVIDIVTELPDNEPVHDVGVSFVSAFARSRGRFANGRAGYFVSARRGYLDLIADAVVDDGEELTPRYSDLFASLDYQLSDSVDVSIQTLLSDDDVTFIDPGDGENFGENSDQQHLWLTSAMEFDSGIFGDVSVFTSNINSVEAGSQDNLPAEVVTRYFDRTIDVTGIRTDWALPIGDNNVFEIGGIYRDLAADYDYRLNSIRRSDFVNNGAPFALIRNIQHSVEGSDAAVYASYRRRVNDKLIVELGARWDGQDYSDVEDDSQVSPRFNAQYSISDAAELRLAWGKFIQPQAIHELAIPDGDLNFYEPEIAEHRVIGLRYQLRTNLELQADLYQKIYDDLRPRYENLLDIYEFAPESNFDRTRVSPVSGEAYGAELTLRGGHNRNIEWWLNYTWSKAEDTIDGTTVLRSWDQRNAATANLMWRGEKWRFSLVARHHSGWPRTPLLVEPVIDNNNNIVGVTPDLSERNSSTFDDYSRVDFRISRDVPLRNGSFEYYFEVFNVFDQSNQCCTTDHTLSIGQGISVAPEFDEFLPLFPSFGFIWRFGPGADGSF